MDSRTEQVASVEPERSQAQPTNIVQRLVGLGINIPTFLQDRLGLVIQLETPDGEVNLSDEVGPASQAVDQVLQRFVDTPQLYPEVFRACERQIREGIYVCDIRNELDLLERLFALAEVNQNNGNQPLSEAYWAMLLVLYLSVVGRASCRFLVGTELDKLLRPLRTLHEDQQTPANLKADIGKATARVSKFLPTTFTDTEKLAFTPHDHGQNDSGNTKALLRKLVQLLIVPESVSLKEEIVALESVDKLITTQISMCYKVICVPLATTISPRRSFPLKESYVLQKVVKNQKAQWQLDGVIGKKVATPGETDAPYLVELPFVDKHSILDDHIDGIEGGDFQFSGAFEAKKFLNKPRIQVELDDGVKDDLFYITENRPYAVARLIEAIMSKCKVATESNDYSGKDAQDDRTKEEMIERFEQVLNRRGDPASNRQLIAAKAEVAVDYLVKLHTEGLSLDWANMPTGARQDINLTATERFQALLDLCTDIKAIPIDWISQAGMKVVAAAVLAPQKYYSIKLSGARSNKKKRQTTQKAKAAEQELAEMKEQEKSEDDDQEVLDADQDELDEEQEELEEGL